MKAILISGSYKGLSIPKEAIKFIEKNIKDNKVISFIASDFEDNEGTKKFVNKLVNLFKEQSIIFEKIHIIDSLKTKEEMHLIFKLSFFSCIKNIFILKKYVK